MNIDKIYHQIWFQGETEIPQKYEKLYSSCIKVNNNFKRIVWDSNKIINLIKNNYPEYFNFYEKLPLMVQKIDFAKYVILYHYGGIYIDMDVKCLKNINNLLNMFPNEDFLVSNLLLSKMEITAVNGLNKFTRGNKAFVIKNMINNGIIISKKKLDITKKIIDDIVKNFYFKYNNNFRDIYIFNTTGPIIFTDSIMKYKGSDKVKVIDSKYMEPCTVIMKKCDFTKSFFRHEHHRTWGTNHLEKIIYFVKTIDKYKYIITLLVIIIIYLIFFRKKK